MTKQTAKREATPEASDRSNATAPEPTRREEGATLNVVGGLPRFNFNARPATDEESVAATPGNLPLRPTYESIQQEAKGSGADKWRQVDKLRAGLTNLYNDLRDDSRYSEEYKAERAWAEYERVREQVEKLAPEAHQAMVKSAESLERVSIPTPEGEGLITKDTNKRLLTAHEYNRIKDLINPPQKGKAPPGWSLNPLTILKRAYAEALDEGGPGGGATVRAIVQLARDFDIDIHAIVDAHRKPRHHEALENAQRKYMQAQSVSRHVPEPPFRKGASRKDIGTYGSGVKGFIPGGTNGMSFRSKRKQRHW